MRGYLRHDGDDTLPVKHTFIHFSVPVKQALRASASCPDLGVAECSTPFPQGCKERQTKGESFQSSRDLEERKPGIELQRFSFSKEQVLQKGATFKSQKSRVSHQWLRPGQQQPSSEQLSLKMHKAMNKELVTLTKKGSGAILEFVGKNLAKMNCINISTALHRAVRCALPGSSPCSVDEESSHSGRAQLLSHHAFKKMLEVIKQKADVAMQLASARGKGMSGDVDFPVQCISIVAWSCAMIQLYDAAVLARLVDLACPHLHELKAYELTNLLWACAKLGTHYPQLYSAAADLMRKREEDYKPHCISLAVWAFATAGWKDTQLFQSFADEMCCKVGHLKPQEVCMTIWAFAQQGEIHHQLFNSICNMWVQGGTMNRFTPQEITDVAWAFATLRFSHASASRLLAHAAVVNYKLFAPKQVAILLHSMASLEVTPQTMQTLFDLAADDIHRFQPAEIAMMTAASAKSCAHRNTVFGSDP